MNIEYGIVCELSDEKKLVKNVNSFLTGLDLRKLYKWPERSIRPADAPFEIDHYYTQFLKETPGWYFDLKPNFDKLGRVRFQGSPDCGWTLFTKPFRDMDPMLDFTSTNEFFSSLVTAIGFPTKQVRAYKPGEDRL